MAIKSPLAPPRAIIQSPFGSNPIWTPAKLTGLLDYWDGQTNVTIAGGRATAWTGKNGTILSAPGAGANQPVQQTWVAGNNATALYFDGNDQLTSAASLLPVTGSYTAFIVGSFDDTAGRCMAAWSQSGGTRIEQNVSGGVFLQLQKGGVGFSTNGAAVTTPLSLIDIETIGADSDTVFYVNGTNTTVSNPHISLTAPGGVVSIGMIASVLFFKGYVAAVALCSGRAPANDIARFKAWSLKKYGV